MTAKRVGSLIIVALLLALSSLIVQHSRAHAALAPDIPILSVNQKDLDGNGTPDLTIVDCAFTGDHDRIYIYGPIGEVRSPSDLLSGVDFGSGTWVFDAGAEGRAELIIRFAVEAGKHVAYLYDDLNGDGNVGYKVADATVEVTESRYWHVKVTAAGAWTLPDGRVNPDLSILIDGPISRFLQWGEANPASSWVTRNLKTDGAVDWEIDTVDQDGDGNADYQLERLMTAIPQEYAVFRSTLYVNKDPKPPTPYPGTVLWPLLVGVHNYEAYGYFQRPPIIAVNWQQAKIERSGILGYPTERGYHINSVAPTWQKGQVNTADFENPMAYYNLADDSDGYPDTFVRFETFGARDPNFDRGQYKAPMTEVEYAWDQNNDQRWDYQLDLGGSQAITGTAQFADFAVQTIPYEIVPRWVTTRQWSAAIFLAAEGGSYRNSEGMSEWTVNRGRVNGQLLEPSSLRNLYLTGFTTVPPAAEYAEMTPGFRGEYAFDLGRQPTLYFSGVDNRLHLMYAENGIWTTLDNHQVRLHNLDGGPYLNQWQSLAYGQVTHELDFLSGYLVYSGDGTVVVKRTPALPEVFETLPPRDHQEWLALGQKLAPYQDDFAAGDLGAMVHQAAGSQTDIARATLSDYRVAERGFRFILELLPGFSVEGADLLPLRGLPSGRYTVTYDGSFHVQPSSPPRLSLSLAADPVADQPSAVNQPDSLLAIVGNDGQEDAPAVVLRIRPVSAGQALAWSEPQTVTVKAGATTSVRFSWIPAAVGDWQVQAEARLLAAPGLLSDPVAAVLPTYARPAAETSLAQDLTAFGLVRPWQFGLLIASLALAGVVLGWRVFAALDAPGRTLVEGREVGDDDGYD